VEKNLDKMTKILFIVVLLTSGLAMFSVGANPLYAGQADLDNVAASDQELAQEDLDNDDTAGEELEEEDLDDDDTAVEEIETDDSDEDPTAGQEIKGSMEQLGGRSRRKRSLTCAAFCLLTWKRGRCEETVAHYKDSTSCSDGWRCTCYAKLF